PFPPVPDLPIITAELPKMLARVGCAQGHAARHCRQAAGRSGEDPGQSRYQGEGGRLRPVPGDQHAGGIFRLHPQGGAALVGRRKRNRDEVRMKRATQLEPIVRLILRLAGCCGAVCACSGLVCLICMLAISDAVAQATADSQSYPNRAVRIIVPFPPGGPTDILTRVVGQRLSDVWHQPVVIENQPGANTPIAAARGPKMAPDGYTLFAVMDVTMVLNPITASNLSYDPLKDFAPITLASKNTSLLNVRAEDGPKTVKELIARAKANPGKLNYGAGIITTRLAGYLFNREVGLDVQYIPFNGSAPT